MKLNEFNLAIETFSKHYPEKFSFAAYSPLTEEKREFAQLDLNPPPHAGGKDITEILGDNEFNFYPQWTFSHPLDGLVVELTHENTDEELKAFAERINHLWNVHIIVDLTYWRYEQKAIPDYLIDAAMLQCFVRWRDYLELDFGRGKANLPYVDIDNYVNYLKSNEVDSELHMSFHHFEHSIGKNTPIFRVDAVTEENVTKVCESLFSTLIEVFNRENSIDTLCLSSPVRILFESEDEDKTLLEDGNDKLLTYLYGSMSKLLKAKHLPPTLSITIMCQDFGDDNYVPSDMLTMYSRAVSDLTLELIAWDEFYFEDVDDSFSPLMPIEMQQQLQSLLLDNYFSLQKLTLRLSDFHMDYYSLIYQALISKHIMNIHMDFNGTALTFGSEASIRKVLEEIKPRTKRPGTVFISISDDPAIDDEDMKDTYNAFIPQLLEALALNLSVDFRFFGSTSLRKQVNVYNDLHDRIRDYHTQNTDDESEQLEQDELHAEILETIRRYPYSVLNFANWIIANKQDHSNYIRLINYIVNNLHIIENKSIRDDVLRELFIIAKGTFLHRAVMNKVDLAVSSLMSTYEQCLAALSNEDVIVDQSSCQDTTPTGVLFPTMDNGEAAIKTQCRALLNNLLDLSDASNTEIHISPTIRDVLKGYTVIMMSLGEQSTISLELMMQFQQQLVNLVSRSEQSLALDPATKAGLSVAGKQACSEPATKRPKL